MWLYVWSRIGAVYLCIWKGASRCFFQCVYVMQLSCLASSLQRMQPHRGQLMMTTQVTTKVPPGFDGKTSWFAFEDAIDDWCEITELESEKWGPALRNRLEGEASVYKRLLDRDDLRQPNGRGVEYFKRTLHWDHILWKELRQFSSTGSWGSWRTIVEMETWWNGWPDFRLGHVRTQAHEAWCGSFCEQEGAHQPGSDGNVEAVNRTANSMPNSSNACWRFSRCSMWRSFPASRQERNHREGHCSANGRHSAQC